MHIEETYSKMLLTPCAESCVQTCATLHQRGCEQTLSNMRSEYFSRRLRREFRSHSIYARSWNLMVWDVRREKVRKLVQLVCQHGEWRFLIRHPRAPGRVQGVHTAAWLSGNQTGMLSENFPGIVPLNALSAKTIV